MAKDPLDIIAQDAKATAQFFGAVNTAVAQSAAADLSAARAASSIIDTTLKAKELQRTNDQQIRSQILQDQRADRQDQRNQAIFEQTFKYADARAQAEFLAAENQQELVRLNIEKERLNQSKQRFALGAANIRSEAFRLANETGDFRYIDEYSRLANTGQSLILGGQDPNKVTSDAQAAFTQFKSRIIPEKSKYSPAITQAIFENYGEDAADNYDLLNNPNKQAAYRSTLTSFVTGTADARRKFRTAQISPEDRGLVEKAISEYDHATSEIQRLTKLRAEFQDPITGAFGQQNTELLDTGGGKSVPIKSLTLEAKVFKTEQIDAKINALLGHRESVLSAVQAGVNIPEFSQPQLTPITGSSGQTAAPTIPTGGLSGEDRAAAAAAATDPNLSTSDSAVLESREAAKSQAANRKSIASVEAINRAEQGMDKPSKVLDEIYKSVFIPQSALSKGEFTIGGHRLDLFAGDFDKKKANLKEQVSDAVSRLEDFDKKILLNRMLDIASEAKRGDPLVMGTVDQMRVRQIQGKVTKKNKSENQIRDELLSSLVEQYLFNTLD